MQLTHCNHILFLNRTSAQNKYITFSIRSFDSCFFLSVCIFDVFLHSCNLSNSWSSVCWHIDSRSSLVSSRFSWPNSGSAAALLITRSRHIIRTRKVIFMIRRCSTTSYYMYDIIENCVIRTFILDALAGFLMIWIGE